MFRRQQVDAITGGLFWIPSPIAFGCVDQGTNLKQKSPQPPMAAGLPVLRRFSNYYLAFLAPFKVAFS
jgi:hypothetical protein